MIYEPEESALGQIEPKCCGIDPGLWLRWNRATAFDGRRTMPPAFVPESLFPPTERLLHATLQRYLGLRSQARYVVLRRAGEDEIRRHAQEPCAWLDEPALNRFPYLVSLMGAVRDVNLVRNVADGAISCIVVARHARSGRYSTLQWTLARDSAALCDVVEVTGSDGMAQALGPWAVQPYRPRLIFRRGKSERIDRAASLDFGRFVDRVNRCGRRTWRRWADVEREAEIGAARALLARACEDVRR